MQINTLLNNSLNKTNVLNVGFTDPTRAANRCPLFYF